MKAEPILLKAMPQEAIWGGTGLRDYFGYKDYTDRVGQTWCFACQNGESNRVVNGTYQGRCLEDLWKNEPQLFQSKQKEFPFIIGLLAPSDDLSVQVHPRSPYARAKGYPYGKQEAWFFVNPPDEGNIVYGHTASDRAELSMRLYDGTVQEVLSLLPVKADDYVYIPAGQIHACRKGSIVYEISQATNLTYRVSDYGRVDQNGQCRTLHIEDALNCIDIPSPRPLSKKAQCMRKTKDFMTEIFDGQGYFSLQRTILHGSFDERRSGYALATVLNGEGQANGLSVKRGDNFIVPANSSVKYEGKMELMLAGEANGNSLEREV